MTAPTPTAHILPFGGDNAHEAAQALLPWHANRSLAADEERWVAAHVAACPRCQADLAIEQRLCEAHAMLPTAGEAHRGFEALRRRIESPSRWAQGKARLHRLLQGWQASSPWLRGAVLVQGLLLALTTTGWAWLASQPEQAAPYQALGNAAPAPSASANLLLRFRPDASERDMRAALQDSGARIVDGPTVTGAYLLTVAPTQAAAALQRLRAAPAVEMAESLAAAGAPP
jgi:Putative zinc-finger